MSHPLETVHKKLERANEQILNLEREIGIFLKEGAYPIIPNDNPAFVPIAAKLHTHRVIPALFAILSGEIIHHLRSCLDHIAWELSSAQKRTQDPKGIEFPIYISKPADKEAIRKFERKIKGIGTKGRDLIEKMQPYHRDPNFMLTSPINDPLWIINDMDITDKHRELILTQASFDIALPDARELIIMLNRQGERPEQDLVELARSFDPDSKITTQIAFAEFGGRKVQPVVPGLLYLANHIHKVALLFANECF